jgi:hypothetical protein
VGDAALRKRHPAGAVADNKRVLASGDLFIVERDALHQFHGIDPLLKTHAAQIVKSEPSEGDHRSAVERCLIQAVHQINRPWASRSDTNAKASGVLGEAGGHECCGFLMADADVLNAILALAQGFDDRVYAVTDNAEDVCRPQSIKVSTRMSDVFGLLPEISVGCGGIASFVSDGGAPRVLTEASVARLAIAVLWRTSRRKNPVVLISLICLLRLASQRAPWESSSSFAGTSSADGRAPARDNLHHLGRRVIKDRSNGNH